MTLPVLLLALAAAPADFTRDVHPIFAAKCFACHSGDKRFGGLSLANYAEVLRGGKTGKVVSPGSSAESLLVRRILGEGVPAMPPEGQRLTPVEVAAIRSWIDQGARPRPDAPPARPNWVPQMALAKPARPAALDTRSGSRISDAAFARRAYLDVWGLLPTPEQLDEFLRAPEHPRLIRTLLAHNRNYAEHWMTFWNDVLRNDEGVNYAGTRKSITPWLLSALELNKPYDQFVRELLDPDPEKGPDGFLTGVNWRGDINASQTPIMQAAQNTAQVFLGVNLKCNSCHDSFVSRWKLKDAYSLAAFFSTERLELVRCDVRLGEFVEPKFLYPDLGGIGATATLDERRAAAASLFTKRENGRFARTIVNRIWKRLVGEGLVEPIDDMDAEPSDPALLDWLAAGFVESGYDLKALIAAIMNTPAYHAPGARRISAEQLVDAVSSITGEWRVRVTAQDKFAAPVREWRLPSSALTRALGRPIRDQVFTARNQEATTLQALELVNGETYTRLLRRASRKMLGELPPPPTNLFDSGRVGGERVRVDVDVTGLREIRLLVVDVDSYSPERVLPVWAEARFSGPAGVDFIGDEEPGRFRNERFSGGLRAKVPSETVIPVPGGLTRFNAVVGVEEKSLQSDISPRIRFFVFTAKPDMDRLVQVKGEPPVAPPPSGLDANALITRVYRHALSRDPSSDERALARKLLVDRISGRPNADGLADLLWSITMLPEFQLM